jgi:hypothetical protein
LGLAAVFILLVSIPLGVDLSSTIGNQKAKAAQTMAKIIAAEMNAEVQALFK